MGAAIRVLVVDDHRMFVDSLVRLLGDEPDLDIVGVAGSGQDAVEALTNAPADVVVLDYQLPDWTGAATARALSARLPDVRVVMLTGHGDGTALRAAAEAGCAAFVTKDKAAHELVDAVRCAHRGTARLTVDRDALAPPGAVHPLVPPLSAREREVLALLDEGLSTEAIAAQLFISRNTVRAHVQRVITKLGAHSKLEAVAVARRLGLFH